ncbi:MAG: hypothetical protein JW724_05385 [Candidatus Altiarchaeota archaeon]|nr:hypothetical protein [Candidatus Altiarchaeota archaeon]
MDFYPLCYCERCGQIKRRDFMRSESECLGCHYDSIEKAKESESQKKKIGREHTGAAPKGAAGLGVKEKAQPRGQARLNFT